MAQMTFRFTTEAELTLNGASFEEIYLKFKDFQHGNLAVQEQGSLCINPPENDQLFFRIENDPVLYRIDHFKGDFKTDIGQQADLSVKPGSDFQLSEHFPHASW